MKKRAFTLAEIMIVLTVIGIITAILLPSARQATPDENVMKFKKAHNLFGIIIRELVTNDKYFSNGDLGIKANGEMIDGSHENDVTYLCHSMANIINTKSNNCENLKNPPYDCNFCRVGIKNGIYKSKPAGEYLDDVCKRLSNEARHSTYFTLPDGTIIFEITPLSVFGGLCQISTCESPDHRCTTIGDDCARMFPPEFSEKSWYAYKSFCIDIDGINEGEDPFGYGLRVDGQIFNGKRANEWLEKSIQGDNDD